MRHVLTYGVSNSATCTCGETFRGAVADDLDAAVATHAVAVLATAMCREAARGLKACYSCRDAARRLWESDVSVTEASR